MIMMTLREMAYFSHLLYPHKFGYLFLYFLTHMLESGLI